MHRSRGRHAHAGWPSSVLGWDTTHHLEYPDTVYWPIARQRPLWEYRATETRPRHAGIVGRQRLHRPLPGRRGPTARDQPNGVGHGWQQRDGGGGRFAGRQRRSRSRCRQWLHQRRHAPRWLRRQARPEHHERSHIPAFGSSRHEYWRHQSRRESRSTPDLWPARTRLLHA